MTRVSWLNKLLRRNAAPCRCFSWLVTSRRSASVLVMTCRCERRQEGRRRPWFWVVSFGITVSRRHLGTWLSSTFHNKVDRVRYSLVPQLHAPVLVRTQLLALPCRTAACQPWLELGRTRRHGPCAPGPFRGLNPAATRPPRRGGDGRLEVELAADDDDARAGHGRAPAAGVAAEPGAGRRSRPPLLLPEAAGRSRRERRAAGRAPPRPRRPARRPRGGGSGQRAQPEAEERQGEGRGVPGVPLVGRDRVGRAQIQPQSKPPRRRPVHTPVLPAGATNVRGATRHLPLPSQHRLHSIQHRVLGKAWPLGVMCVCVCACVCVCLPARVASACSSVHFSLPPSL